MSFILDTLEYCILYYCPLRKYTTIFKSFDNNFILMLRNYIVLFLMIRKNKIRNMKYERKNAFTNIAKCYTDANLISQLKICINLKNKYKVNDASEVIYDIRVLLLFFLFYQTSKFQLNIL